MATGLCALGTGSTFSCGPLLVWAGDTWIIAKNVDKQYLTIADDAVTATARRTARKTARLDEHLWESASVSCWADATARVWWRWIGHIGIICVLRLTAVWGDEWWRKTMKALHPSIADPDRQGLNRGYRDLGVKRWDDAVQKTHLLLGEVPWHQMAEDRNLRTDTYMEPTFVARLLQRTSRRNGRHPPSGRFIVPEDVWRLRSKPIVIHHQCRT